MFGCFSRFHAAALQHGLLAGAVFVLSNTISISTRSISIRSIIRNIIRSSKGSSSSISSISNSISSISSISIGICIFGIALWCGRKTGTCYGNLSSKVECIKTYQSIVLVLVLVLVFGFGGGGLVSVSELLLSLFTAVAVRV